MISPVTAHRRFLHQIPEPDDHLDQTLLLIRGVLRGRRCTFFSPIPGSVCAWFDFGRTETAAFLAELDGSPVPEPPGRPYASRHPGRMHAAGNDGHAAMLLALAEWLAQRTDVPPRNVLAVFQPFGAAGTGAARLCRTGLAERYHVARVYGLRLWPGIPPGETASRPGALTARWSGVAVSVSGRDALAAGAEFLLRAERLNESAVPPSGLRFHRMAAGPDSGIPGGGALLEGVLRTGTPADFQAYRTGLDAVGQAVSAARRCGVDFRFHGGRPPVWNDETLYAAVCAGLGPDAPSTLAEPSLAVADAAAWRNHAPGVECLLGIGDAPEPGTPDFDFDDEAVLPRGLAFLQKLAYLA